eukprot:1392699-Amorphochlora_amoeboformis.AAC.1
MESQSGHRARWTCSDADYVSVHGADCHTLGYFHSKRTLISTFVLPWSVWIGGQTEACFCHRASRHSSGRHLNPHKRGTPAGQIEFWNVTLVCHL